MNDGIHNHHNIASQHHNIARQHHEIARQHHEHARRAAEQSRHTFNNQHSSFSHHAAPSVRHGAQRSGFDFDGPSMHHRMAGPMRSSGGSGFGRVLFGFLAVLVLLAGVAFFVLRADGVFQQGQDRARAVYCEQAAKVSDSAPPGC
jgi:hypothetical protein